MILSLSLPLCITRMDWYVNIYKCYYTRLDTRERRVRALLLYANVYEPRVWIERVAWPSSSICKWRETIRCAQRSVYTVAYKIMTALASTIFMIDEISFFPSSFFKKVNFRDIKGEKYYVLFVLSGCACYFEIAILSDTVHSVDIWIPVFAIWEEFRWKSATRMRS